MRPDPRRKNVHHVKPTALALLAVLAVSGDVTTATADPSTRPAFAPCRLEHRSKLVSIDAECAHWDVPETAGAAGRTVRLFIARIPAINRRKAPDPLFLIAGGPGMGSVEMYTGVSAAFARVNRDRDIVLLDQRGTGRSTRLQCELDDDALLDAQREDIEAVTRDCLASLQSKHDVTQFTTSVAVRDLDAVRRALGYPRINLYGVSYGTRVALHYLRRHPDAVRSVVLDGVAPPGLALGPGIAMDAEAAMARILERCREDRACRDAFGDPAATYRGVRAALGRGPVEVTLPDPRTSAPRRMTFSAKHLAAVLRLQSYAAGSAALLPYALDAAARKSDYTPLAGLYLMIESGSTDLLAYGMHNSVVCTEDLPFVAESTIDRSRLAATYLGVDPLDGLRWICGTWPRGVLDADLRSPLSADTPVLLLSGADDPVTPPANGARVARTLTRSRHVVVPQAGHGQLGQRCIGRVFERFYSSIDPAALNVDCLTKVTAPPFFLSSAGPAP
jgi:pimeloyl-ACP methyl ester carboxylesterase